MGERGSYFSGTSGLAFSEPNKKAYPEEFREVPRLVYYSSMFNSIEINSSFYKIPRCKTFLQWMELVPEHFRFTVKLWKGITHDNKISEGLAIQQFFDAIECFGEKKGCLLIQFPSSAAMDIYEFRDIMTLIHELDRDRSWKPAVEFRHPKWYNAETKAILDDFGATLVLHDMPASAPEKINPRATFIYLRFHGINGDYRGDYPLHFLKEKSREIRQWMDEGKDVYTYFNNTAGSAVENLRTLNRLVKES
jgi:uncharacterized protein YecE (DUF72 family)